MFAGLLIWELDVRKPVRLSAVISAAEKTVLGRAREIGLAWRYFKNLSTRLSANRGYKRYIRLTTYTVLESTALDHLL